MRNFSDCVSRAGALRITVYIALIPLSLYNCWYMSNWNYRKSLSLWFTPKWQFFTLLCTQYFRRTPSTLKWSTLQLTGVDTLGWWQSGMRMFSDTLSPSSDYGLAKGEASEGKVASNSQKSPATHEQAFGMKHLYLPFGTLAVWMVVTVFPLTSASAFIISSSFYTRQLLFRSQIQLKIV